MGEISKFVHHGASLITPRVLHGIHKQLPMLKLEFSQIQNPSYPHLSEQLDFLSDVLEDFAEGAGEDVPYITVACVAFAIAYAHRKLDLIPDTIPDLGRSDDSSVVRVVMLEHEKYLSAHAAKIGMNWSTLSLMP